MEGNVLTERVTYKLKEWKPACVCVCVQRRGEAQLKWNGLKAFRQTEDLDVYKEGSALDRQTNRHIGPDYEQSLRTDAGFFSQKRGRCKMTIRPGNKENSVEIMWSLNLESRSRTDMKWRLMLSTGLERTKAGKQTKLFWLMEPKSGWSSATFRCINISL